MKLQSAVLVTAFVIWTTAGYAKASSSEPARVYWTNTTGTIQRANLDGTDLVDVVVDLNVPNGIDLDIGGAKMYWANKNDNKIQRANLDGTDVEDIVASTMPRNLVLDVSRNKMYWTVSAGFIMRANLDGTGVEEIVTGLHQPLGIAVDVLAGKVYWTETDGTYERIARANLDGTGLESVISLTSYAAAVAVDINSGKLYCTHDNPPSGSGQALLRANLDGSDMEYLPNLPVTSIYGLEVEPVGQKLYWSVVGGSNGMGSIGRCDLDGTNAEVFLSSLDRPHDLAIIIPEPATMSLLVFGAIGLLRRRRKQLTQEVQNEG